MNPYIHKCPICKAPSRNIHNSIICSNVRCKTWHDIRKQAVLLSRALVVEHGLTADDPIILICPICKSGNEINCGISYSNLWCRCCNLLTPINLEHGKWYITYAASGTYYVSQYDAVKEWKDQYEYKPNH